MICEYGCGRKAKHQFKNKKWCCENHYSKCPNKRKENIGGKRFSEELRQKMSNLAKIRIGKHNPFFGKTHSDKTKNHLKNIQKLSIEVIEIKYPLFYKIEEIRYNSDKTEIQVRCKNHNCQNSKDKNGWFTPTYSQLYERIRNIEKHNIDNAYFYCCDKCKQECPLFNLKFDPFKLEKQHYTQEEYNIWRNEVLKRAEYKCEYCGNRATHAHHSRPQKLEPFFSLDPDFGISCCEKCHYKYGHKDECSTGQLANIICQKGYEHDKIINNTI